MAMTKEKKRQLIVEIKAKHSVDWLTVWSNRLDAEILTTPLNAKRHTALHVACQFGNQQTVRAILDALETDEARQEAVLQEAKGGWTPLQLAVACGLTRTAEMLLNALGPEKARYEVDLRSSDGWTLLLLAIRYNRKNPDVVSMLLRKIRELKTLTGEETKGEAEQSPVQTALLQKTRKDWTPLHLAAAYDSSARIVKMIFDVLETDEARRQAVLRPNNNKDGWTPLHLVAIYGSAKTAKTILETLGPEIVAEVTRQVDHINRTVLHLAAQYTPKNIITIINALMNIGLGETDERLEKAGAKEAAPEAKEEDETPTHRLKKVRQVMLLRDNDGWTALHLAAKFCSAKAVRKILEILGPEACKIATLTINSYWTALHLAVQREPYCPEIIQALVEVLGSEAEEIMTVRYSPLSKVRHIIKEVVETTFFEKLFRRQPLTEVQEKLCVNHKSILLRKLVEPYLPSSRVELNNNDSINRFIQGLSVDKRNNLCRTLQQAINLGTPLSRVLRKHRHWYGPLFSGNTATVTKIQEIIEMLLTTNGVSASVTAPPVEGMEMVGLVGKRTGRSP